MISQKKKLKCSPPYLLLGLIFLILSEAYVALAFIICSEVCPVLHHNLHLALVLKNIFSLSCYEPSQDGTEWLEMPRLSW